MHFNLLQEPPQAAPCAPRRTALDWLKLVAYAAFVALVALSALLNIYTSLHLAPVVTKVNSLFERADVLFSTVYRLGCNYSHFIPPDQCAQL